MSEGHYCSKHDVTFFKKGKMRGYAHPVKDDEGNDTGEWCNEDTPPEVAEPSSKTVQSTTAPIKVESNTDRRIVPEERGMWWKELGESLRYGLIDHSKPHGREWKRAYFTEMKRVLNLPEKTE